MDSNDFELVTNANPSSNNRNSGIELVSTIVQRVPAEVWKEGASFLFNQFNKYLDNEREGKKKIIETRIESIFLEINNLIDNISKEEAKEDYNQERINTWYNRLDIKQLELKEMQDVADGLVKGLIKLTKQFIGMRKK